MNMGEEAKIRGNEQYSKGNYERAVEWYTQAIDKSPEQSAYYGNRAAALVMLGKYEEALRDCRAGLNIQPEFVKLLLRAGKCSLVLGDLEESRQFYQRANSLDPGNVLIQAELKALERAVENEHMFRQCYKNNRYIQANYFLTQLLQAVTRSLPLQLLKAQLIIDSGQPKSALDYIKTLPQQATEVMVLKGEALFYGGLAEEARTVLREAVRLQPGCEKAREILRRMREMERMKDKGNRLFKDKRTEEAIGVYTQALALDPKHRLYNSLILANQAAAYMAQREFVRALEDCNRSLTLNPNYTRAYLRRANVQMELESFEEALQDYNRVKDLDPRTPNIDANIAFAKEKASQAGKKDYYKILGVEKQATEEQLKRAYRQMALRWHPDKNAETPEKHSQSEKLFKDVSEAYAVLSDPQQRQRYDAGLSVQETRGRARPHSDPTQIFQMFFGRGDSSTFSDFRPFTTQ